MMHIQVEMGHIICNTCGHKLYIAQIYDGSYYNSLVCSECNNLYMQPKQENKTEESSDGAQ